jgi:hypothetical protein
MAVTPREMMIPFTARRLVIFLPSSWFSALPGAMPSLDCDTTRTQCPVLHAEQDPTYPIGFIDHDRCKDLCMAAKQGANVLFCVPNRTQRILLVSAITTGARTLCMAAKQGANVLFCMPDRTKCIL